MQGQEQFIWERQAAAASLLESHIATFLEAHAPTRLLSERMATEASTQLFDWLDHVTVHGPASLQAEAEETGFVVEDVVHPDGATVLWHPRAQLPRLVLYPTSDSAPVTTNLGIKVESVSSFLLIQQIKAPIAGTPYSPLRLATVWEDNGRSLSLVERRGYRGFDPQSPGDDYAERYLQARERWATRNRALENTPDAMAHGQKLAEALVNEIGRDTAAWIVFDVEREYWERRNWAGQVQKARQDRLGLGWANHDHHTFRSSRVTFAPLVATLETLGFECRERYYAGDEAGWGAQIMEQPAGSLITFLDVDLFPDEKAVDFAHDGLPSGEQYGTVGLWCALHGDSILGAGMHHLEAQFSFDDLRDDLETYGIGMMKPFSDMPHLRQAFTKGERWMVEPNRLKALHTQGSISDKQYAQFTERGAVGSHLENLQRAEGFKGFNQKNVSDIIRETDPRQAAMAQ